MAFRGLSALSLATVLAIGPISARSEAAPDGSPSAPANAKQGRPDGKRRPIVQRVALSVGSPTDGALEGGVPVEPSPHLSLRWPDGPRWALPRLVRMLHRAARRVEQRHPGSILLVGELSNRDGGELSGHASHESGRDVDIGFYYIDASGRSVRTDRLMRVGSHGRVADDRRLRFDDARNWRLIEAILTDSEVVVQNMFLADALSRRLLAFAERSGVSKRILRRARAALRQPSSGPPHDDHLHVRIACPPGQRGVCIPTPGPRAPRPPSSRTAALPK
jgi:penicillin-insensitive murein endopeptidase